MPAIDYETVTRPVTLTADIVLNVELARPPRAVIESVPDTLQGILQPDGTYALAPTAVNSGNGCAGSVSGSTDLRNNAGLIKTVVWSLPATTLIRPAERFTYQVCCMTRDEAFSAGANYFTRFTDATVSCP